MADSVAGVVLAAGAGTRLRPLTIERPKALCPFGTTTLAVQAIGHLRRVADAVAVNAHDRPGEVEAALGSIAHVSVEPELLGSAGALGALRDWIGGRPVLVANADTVHAADLAAFAHLWDGERTAFLLAEPAGSSLAPGVRLVASLMPWSLVRAMPAEPHGLYARWWAPEAAAGRAQVVGGYAGPWFDCGTPASYLAANLWCSGGASIVGAGAVVRGEVVRSVIWPGATVSAQERLVDAVRTAGGRTVLVR